MGKSRRKTTRREGKRSDAKARSDAVEPALRTADPHLWLIALLVAAVGILVYLPSTEHQFVNWDDPDYVLDNTALHDGLTPEAVGWAFTTWHAGNWHPLTWLSHAADVDLHGITAGRFDAPEAGGHHTTSVLLHAVNGALVFIVLRRLTRRRWPSVIVAMLFLLHPLRVESVSWVAERKDLLCAFFMLLTVWAHVAWVEKGRGWRYAVVVLACAAALMSKPMAVTLPFVLLLLDWWPLGRLSWKAVGEKLPLVAMVAVSCVVTVMAQRAGSAFEGGAELSLLQRIAHAVYATVMYLWQTLWPANLSPFHPLPHLGGPHIAAWMIGLFSLLLVGILLVALWQRRKRPYLLVGWLLYLGMLVPVIGLVQVGRQIMADRYTYMPQIGVFIAVVYLSADLVQRWPKRRFVWPAILAVLVVLATLSWQQQAVWAESQALWQRVARVYPRDSMSRRKLGQWLWEHGKQTQALEQYRLACEAQPSDALAHVGLGNKLFKLGQLKGASEHFELARNADKTYGPAYVGLGGVRLREGRHDEAIAFFREALRVSPDVGFGIRMNLGLAFSAKGDMDSALDQYEAALALAPNAAQAAVAHESLAQCLARVGRLDDAAKHRQAARNLRRTSNAE